MRYVLAVVAVLGGAIGLTAFVCGGGEASAGPVTAPLRAAQLAPWCGYSDEDYYKMMVRWMERYKRQPTSEDFKNNELLRTAWDGYQRWKAKEAEREKERQEEERRRKEYMEKVRAEMARREYQKGLDLFAAKRAKTPPPDAPGRERGTLGRLPVRASGTTGLRPIRGAAPHLALESAHPLAVGSGRTVQFRQAASGQRCGRSLHEAARQRQGIWFPGEPGSLRP